MIAYFNRCEKRLVCLGKECGLPGGELQQLSARLRDQRLPQDVIADTTSTLPLVRRNPPRLALLGALARRRPAVVRLAHVTLRAGTARTRQTVSDLLIVRRGAAHASTTPTRLRSTTMMASRSALFWLFVPSMWHSFSAKPFLCRHL